MNEHESRVKRRRRRSPSTRTPPPRWPGDPDRDDGIDVDVEAIAHVLANTCRWGGRTRRFLSLAQHALTVSEEIEALDGIADEDRRVLALHALLMPARAAWLGDEEGEHPASARAAARTRAQGGAIDRAVREAAGLDPELPEDSAEVLRFVERMTDAAETRDLGVDAGGFPFPSAAARHPAHGARGGGRALARAVPGARRVRSRRHRPCRQQRERLRRREFRRNFLVLAKPGKGLAQPKTPPPRRRPRHDRRGG